jgi:hypothetical protein
VGLRDEVYLFTERGNTASTESEHLDIVGLFGKAVVTGAAYQVHSIPNLVC